MKKEVKENEEKKTDNPEEWLKENQDKIKNFPEVEKVIPFNFKFYLEFFGILLLIGLTILTFQIVVKNFRKK